MVTSLIVKLNLAVFMTAKTWSVKFENLGKKMKLRGKMHIDIHL